MFINKQLSPTEADTTVLRPQEAKPQSKSKGVKNIVLVHGAFADGSSWARVIPILQAKGYNVIAVQNPLTSLEEDVAATQRALGMMDAPILLAAHSYGGMVITEAGNDPKVVGLVYVAAFVPDTGESVNKLIEGFPQDGPQPPILPPQDGFLFLDREKFHDSFAADVDADLAAFMADSQVPWGLEALGGTISEAAWRTKPSWYLVTTEDRMIPPQAQREMSGRAGATVDEAAASHSVYVSQPAAVADVIKKAASAT